jgi:hypothetical protein
MATSRKSCGVKFHHHALSETILAMTVVHQMDIHPRRSEISNCLKLYATQKANGVPVESNEGLQIICL